MINVLVTDSRLQVAQCSTGTPLNHRYDPSQLSNLAYSHLWKDFFSKHCGDFSICSHSHQTELPTCQAIATRLTREYDTYKGSTFRRNVPELGSFAQSKWVKLCNFKVRLMLVIQRRQPRAYRPVYRPSPIRLLNFAFLA